MNIFITYFIIFSHFTQSEDAAYLFPFRISFPFFFKFRFLSIPNADNISKKVLTVKHWELKGVQKQVYNEKLFIIRDFGVDLG